MEISEHRNGVDKEILEKENEKSQSMTFRKILQVGQHLSWNIKDGILKWRA